MSEVHRLDRTDETPADVLRKLIEQMPSNADGVFVCVTCADGSLIRVMNGLSCQDLLWALEVSRMALMREAGLLRDIDDG